MGLRQRRDDDVLFIGPRKMIVDACGRARAWIMYRRESRGVVVKRSDGGPTLGQPDTLFAQRGVRACSGSRFALPVAVYSRRLFEVSSLDPSTFHAFC